MTFHVQRNLCRASLILCALMAGCAVNSDGSVTAGFRGSLAWIREAPRQDVEAYFDAEPLADLCSSLHYAGGTSKTVRSEEVLAEIEACLRRRGLSGAACDDYWPRNRAR